MAAALELYFMASGLFGTGGRPPMRVMHCFPLLEHSYKYTKTKLNIMIKTAKLLSGKAPNSKVLTYIESKIDRVASSKDSLQFKQFVNGNHLFIESTGINADRLRGITCDAIFYDEAQDIPGAALSNANKSLTKAQYGRVGDGIQIYFGTPKQKGSDFHRWWMASSRQYYHLGCENCGKYFPLYTPESNDWENIWINDDIPSDYIDPKTKLKPHGFVVKCIHCQHLQDKRIAAERGKWIASNTDEDHKAIGYHLNQLYMPTLPRQKIIDEKPERHPNNTERSYQNEVLGEFFAGEATPITADEIRQYCGDYDRKFSRSIALSENKRVYMGCDWGEKVDMDQVVGAKGKSQGQSYSSAVILSVEGPNLLSVEFVHLLKKNDMAYKKAIVDQLMRQYSVSLAVGDIGYANDLMSDFQREYGDRFLASRAMGSVKHHVKLAGDVFPKEIQFERDFFIEELIGRMKAGNIRIPLGDYEKIGIFLEQLAGMELRASTDRAGNIRIHYRKGVLQII